MCNKEPKPPHTHKLRSGLAVTIYAQDLLRTIYADGLRSRSTLAVCAHDLALTTWHSRSMLTVCAHDLRSRSALMIWRSRSICAHEQELHRDDLYQLTFVRCVQWSVLPAPSAFLSRLLYSHVIAQARPNHESSTLNCSQPLSIVIPKIAYHSTKKMIEGIFQFCLCYLIFSSPTSI